MRRLLALLLFATACGASAERVVSVRTATTPSHALAPSRRPPPGCLWHDELAATVEAGLGAFLKHVDVQPHLVDQKFSGFSIVALRPRAYWEGVDLKPGDIVVSVNGMPIERPTEAFLAFTSLRTATELRVALVRDGTPRQLVFRIIERASVSRAASTSGPKTARGRSNDPARRAPTAP